MDEGCNFAAPGVFSGAAGKSVKLGQSVVFKMIDRLSHSSPDACINEDAVGATNAGAWVIDGATGVSDRPPIVARTTDAAWLAERLNAQLRATLDTPDLDPVQALSRVEAKIKSELLALTRGVFCPASEQPSAAFALAALRGKILHLIGIADCRIIYETRAGEIGEFDPSDRAASVGEALIVAERHRLMAEYPDENPRPRLNKFIQTLREQANQDGGYSVVHSTRPWAGRVKQETFEASKIRHLLLLSDGFYRLVDVFKAMTLAELMERTFAKGLRELYSQLRALEVADAACANHPRVKAYDDASAILVEIPE